jgi:hypothetical protein
MKVLDQLENLRFLGEDSRGLDALILAEFLLRSRPFNMIPGVYHMM